MTPSTVTKKKLTVTDAAKQWVAAKKAENEAKALLKEAAPVLLAHFEKTGKKTYKDLVGVSQGPPRTILDQDAVKEFLGARLTEFQTTSTPRPSLFLL